MRAQEFITEQANPRVDLTPNYPNYQVLVGEFIGVKKNRYIFQIVAAELKPGQGPTEKIVKSLANHTPVGIEIERVKNRKVVSETENTNQAAVDALLKKHGWSMGRTVNGDLAMSWQGSKYEFFGERVRITRPDGKSVSVVWGQKPNWQGRPGDISFAQAVQQKYLTFDLPIWQALDRRQISDTQAMQQFKAENERQAREAVAQGVTEGTEHFGGVEISMEKEDDEIMVTAMMAGGRELGHVLFVIDGEYLAPQDLEVDERYQGQGIAATMYDYVKSKGYKIRRSGQQTDAGAGFWNKHRPGKNVWEQGVTEGREEFNQAIMQPGFEFEQEIAGITYKVTNDSGVVMVTAWDPEGNSIGHAVFWKHQTRSGLESLSTEVNTKWHGKGIAANMYAVVRMLGANINPSLFQTRQGKNMWKKWQQQGDVAHLKRMNTNIKENIKVDPVTRPLRIQPTQTQPKQHVYVAPDKKKTPAAVIHIKPTDVAETINSAILNTRFKHKQVIGDYIYTATAEDFEGAPLLWIKAYDGNKEIGHVLFEIIVRSPGGKRMPSADYLESGGTEVDPAYRDKGVASTMYAYAKMLGNDIRASYNQTSQGKAMWAAWEKAGDAKHLIGTAAESTVSENFADGKVKGKSRPGRVKRAGASCDGSVTDLRARAKNASGERAKMYHWCANMKSGRNKN